MHHRSCSSSRRSLADSSAARRSHSVTAPRQTGRRRRSGLVVVTPTCKSPARRRAASLARYEALARQHETPMMKLLREKSEKAGNESREARRSDRSTRTPTTRSLHVHSPSRSRSVSPYTTSGRSLSPRSSGSSHVTSSSPSGRSPRRVPLSIPRHMREHRSSRSVDTHRHCTAETCDAETPPRSKQPKPILYSPHRAKSVDRRAAVKECGVAFSSQDVRWEFDEAESSRAAGSASIERVRSKAHRQQMKENDQRQYRSRSPSPVQQKHRPVSPYKPRSPLRQSSRSPKETGHGTKRGRTQSPRARSPSSPASPHRKYINLNGRKVYYEKDE